MFGRKKMAMVVAEFMGTFVLTSAVYAVVIERLPALFVAAAAAATLGLVVLTVGEISGAHINPAVTVGMWTIRKIETSRAVVYIASQFLGALVAWRLNEYFLAMPLQNIATKKFDWRVLTAEAVGTFIFTFGIASAVYQGYKGLRKAVTIGASLGLGALIASAASNGLLNPAVALGTRSWSFAYVAGPLVGAIIGMNLYVQLFAQKTVKVAVKKPVKKRK